MGNDKGFGRQRETAKGTGRNDDDGVVASSPVAPVAPVTFTIRGVELAANEHFVDTDWLPLYRWATEDPAASLQQRKRSAWEALCEILPGADQQADWQRDGKIALSTYELVELIGWAGQQLERRKDVKALIEKQKAKPGFGELLAEQSVGMVNFEAEDVTAQMSIESVFSDEQDLSLPGTQPGKIADQAAYDLAIAQGIITELPPGTEAETAIVEPCDADLIVQQAQKSPDPERQSRIEALRAELALLEG